MLPYCDGVVLTRRGLSAEQKTKERAVREQGVKMMSKSITTYARGNQTTTVPSHYYTPHMQV